MMEDETYKRLWRQNKQIQQSIPVVGSIYILISHNKNHQQELV